MVLRSIIEALELRSNAPNKFTTYYGGKVKEARKERGVSQSELAEAIYRRRATVSDLENGKVMPDMETVVLIALFLKKPLQYFLVIEPYTEKLFEGELNADELEILQIYRQIEQGDLKALAKEQLQAIVNSEKPGSSL